MKWTDNHCHLAAETVGDQAAEAAQAGVERLITVGTDVAESRRCIEIARAHPGIWATAGVHPHDAKDGTDGLAELLGEPEIVAVGECGLDYYYDHSPREVQRTVFAHQIGLAHEHELPLVIHTREAWDDTFAILDADGVPDRTVFHCFTGGPTEAEAALERGAHLSFSGIVTFKTADDLRAAAALCPPDRLMVETDSPYLTPVPHRGEPNRPALVRLVGAAVAAAQGVEVEMVASASWAAAERFYQLT
jgi:TatD DNase family protein